MRRDKAMEALNGLPAEFELEQLIERRVFIEKVEKGLEQIHNAQTKTHEKVKQLAQAWRSCCP